MSWKTISLLITGVIFLTSCDKSAPDKEPHNKSFFAMDTYMSITAYGKNADTALNQVEEKVSELENLWSVTRESSEFYKINHSNGQNISVSPETAELIDFSIEISEITDGALDCSIYPVLTEWGFTTGDYKIPTDERLSELLEYTDYRKINFDGKSISIPENMQIDSGAVGKGLTGDIITEILVKNGIDSALLDLGGNIQTIGKKPDDTEWKIGLRSPFDEGNFATLEISDCAVITSGGYERYFIGEDGKTYWHILDPATGRPAESGLVSVTVIGREGKLCDALSTALFVMGLEKSEDLWKSRNDFEMVVVTDDGKIYLTEGIEDKFSLNQMYANLYTEVIYR
ncbi:MAG: FAD:protein FMN transferase [Ruminococcus sp.]|nr:FAD:protein FMN transferase [Ruminococcus sp.]